MGKLLLDNISGIAGEAVKLPVLIVSGVVLLDRVKNATSQLNTRVAALDQWRDAIQAQRDLSGEALTKPEALGT